MGILMMDSMGWPYDSFDCLSLYGSISLFSKDAIIFYHNFAKMHGARV